MPKLGDALEIVPLARPPDAWVTVPGSKSITNRGMVLGALAEGTTVLEGALWSDDAAAMLHALAALGFPVEARPAPGPPGVPADGGSGGWPAREILIRGAGGRIPAAEAALDARGAGTVARFLVAAATLGSGRYRVDGNAQMRRRPMGPLLEALRVLGARLEELGEPGRLPVVVHGTGLAGGEVTLDASASSQFLSALLLVAPYAARDTVIRPAGGLVARPYVTMTCRMMAAFGAGAVEAAGTMFRVRAGGRYAGRRYAVEPDASSASYFFAAAAVTGGTVRVRGLGPDSLQGDAAFPRVLAGMGCRVEAGEDFLAVTGPPGGRLRAVDVDLRDMSDLALTVGALAPFADGPTRIRGVGHIRLQESDRIRAAVTELGRLGIRAEEMPDGLVVYPGRIRPGTVETYDDHRVAMAFSVIGLVCPGIRIANPGCVAKTFPGFFEALDQLR